MAGNTKDEDRAIAKTARAAIARSPLDISELNISCFGGYIELGGRVRAPRGGAGTISVRREFEVLKTLIKNVRGVKDVQGQRVSVVD